MWISKENGFKIAISLILCAALLVAPAPSPSASQESNSAQLQREVAIIAPLDPESDDSAERFPKRIRMRRRFITQMKTASLTPSVSGRVLLSLRFHLHTTAVRWGGCHPSRIREVWGLVGHSPPSAPWRAFCCPRKYTIFQKITCP